MSVKTFAAIDVGSFELNMKIYEFSGKNRMREVDCVSRRLDLGGDTYSNGKISNEKLDELCRTLKEFKEIMNTYQVEEYKAYGTSAIRESENRDILLDQIRQSSGIKVVSLSNPEQRFLGYKALASKGESFWKIIEEKTAIVDIGGGSIQITLFDNGTLISTQNIKIGVLRIQEYLDRFSVGYTKMDNFIEEMAMAQLDNYKKLYLKDREIINLVVIDDYISPWAVKRLGGNSGKAIVDKDFFKKVMEQLRTESPMQTARALDVPEEKVCLMGISGVLVGRITELIGATKIWTPGVTLCDGIAYEYAEKIKMFREEHDFEEDILACAMNISKRYMGSRKRAETLEYISTTIFEAMKKVHGLGRRELLYLRLAAILLDCGKYISMVHIGESGYQIIMATEIIGLSQREREIVANVVRFIHSKFIYDGPLMSAGGLDKEAYLIIAKLTSILQVANGLDRSHKQKLKGLKASLKENQLILTIDTAVDITLEKGFFEEKSKFFQEVFNVKPILKQKKVSEW